MSSERTPTRTSAFGVGKRENHDASAFYARFAAPELSADDTVAADRPTATACVEGDSRDLTGVSGGPALADNSVALVVTSPPYFVGKEYEDAVRADGAGSDGVPASYLDFLQMLHDVFAECARVLEPGGRIAVNVANLGRKPYRSLSADIIGILQDELGLLLRGEIVWQKGRGSTGSCAWGSFRQAANPVLRDVTERVIVASKGRFDRARPAKVRAAEGLPHRSTMPTDEFMEATLDIWEIEPESARRVDHPAPFPVGLPQRLIELYTYADDVVLDPFCGSGSTLVAAERTGRIGVGVDADPDYVATANQRVADEVGSEAGDPPDLLPVDVQVRVTEAARKAGDLAFDALEAAGFEIRQKQRRVGEVGLSIDYVVATDGDAVDLPVLLAGGFTTVRPGLLRSDAVWKTIARLSVLAATATSTSTSTADGAAPPGTIVLTAAPPRPGTDTDRALRALRGRGLFDVVTLLDAPSEERLAAYAAGATTRPQAGFWTDDEIAEGWA